MKQTGSSGEEPDSTLPMWRIICAELEIDLVGSDLSALRREAKGLVDERGDRKKDYRFESFNSGNPRPDSSFVLTPTQGLRDFQRHRIRHLVAVR
jgi:hypothetical protein